MEKMVEALVVEPIESDTAAPTMVLRYGDQTMSVPFPMLVRMAENILAMRDAFVPAHREPKERT